MQIILQVFYNIFPNDIAFSRLQWVKRERTPAVAGAAGVLCQGVWPIGLSDVFLSSYDVDTFREVEEVGCSRGTFDECAVEAIDVAVLGSED